MKYVVAVLAIAIGVAGVVTGGADDSPGFQLLGVLLIIGAVVLGVRMVQRSK
jgi:drug/metabolite transporter (DMT)-like permease